MIQPRSAQSSTDLPGRTFTFGNLHLEADGTLTRGDAVIHLPPKELAALILLLAHAGQIVTQPAIEEDVVGQCARDRRQRAQVHVIPPRVTYAR